MFRARRITVLCGQMEYAEVELLGARCESLKRAYGAAVTNLFDIGYMATPAEYRQLRMLVQEAKHDLEVARKELAKVGLKAMSPTA